MLRENVEPVKRALEAMNRGDVDAVLKELDPEVEWNPALPMLRNGELAVHRGHHGVREFFQQVEELLSEIHYEVSLILDLDDRVVTIGSIRARDRESGAETESRLIYVWKKGAGKTIQLWSCTDSSKRRGATGLRE
jgi:ketosteroid isomerase-like protein